MGKATFKDLPQLPSVFKLGEEIPFALEILESEKSTEMPPDGQSLKDVCEQIAVLYGSGQKPTTELLKKATEISIMCNKSSREDYSCVFYYVEVAYIFVLHEMIAVAKAALEKHNCVPNTYCLELTQSEKDAYDAFQAKWSKRTPNGWYGISLWNCPASWIKALDEIMDAIAAVDATFAIYQVKLKFGGCRWYTGSDFGGYRYVEELIEAALYDSKLIY